jgi:hypothetical protein
MYIFLYKSIHGSGNIHIYSALTVFIYNFCKGPPKTNSCEVNIINLPHGMGEGMEEDIC